jgi:hypothetical protein
MNMGINIKQAVLMAASSTPEILFLYRRIATIRQLRVAPWWIWQCSSQRFMVDSEISRCCRER